MSRSAKAAYFIPASMALSVLNGLSLAWTPIAKSKALLKPWKKGHVARNLGVSALITLSSVASLIVLVPALLGSTLFSTLGLLFKNEDTVLYSLSKAYFKPSAWILKCLKPFMPETRSEKANDYLKDLDNDAPLKRALNELYSQNTTTTPKQAPSTPATPPVTPRANNTPTQNMQTGQDTENTTANEQPTEVKEKSEYEHFMDLIVAQNDRRIETYQSAFEQGLAVDAILKNRGPFSGLRPVQLAVRSKSHELVSYVLGKLTALDKYKTHRALLEHLQPAIKEATDLGLTDIPEILLAPLKQREVQEIQAKQENRKTALLEGNVEQLIKMLKEDQNWFQTDKWPMALFQGIEQLPIATIKWLAGNSIRTMILPLDVLGDKTVLNLAIEQGCAEHVKCITEALLADKFSILEKVDILNQAHKLAQDTEQTEIASHLSTCIEQGNLQKASKQLQEHVGRQNQAGIQAILKQYPMDQVVPDDLPYLLAANENRALWLCEQFPQLVVASNLTKLFSALRFSKKQLIFKMAKALGNQRITMQSDWFFNAPDGKNFCHSVFSNEISGIHPDAELFAWLAEQFPEKITAEHLSTMTQNRRFSQITLLCKNVNVPQEAFEKKDVCGQAILAQVLDQYTTPSDEKHGEDYEACILAIMERLGDKTPEHLIHEKIDKNGEANPFYTPFRNLFPSNDKEALPENPYKKVIEHIATHFPKAFLQQTKTGDTGLYWAGSNNRWDDFDYILTVLEEAQLAITSVHLSSGRYNNNNNILSCACRHNKPDVIERVASVCPSLLAKASDKDLMRWNKECKHYHRVDMLSLLKKLRDEAQQKAQGLKLNDGSASTVVASDAAPTSSADLNQRGGVESGKTGGGAKLASDATPQSEETGRPPFEVTLPPNSGPEIG